LRKDTNVSEDRAASIFKVELGLEEGIDRGKEIYESRYEAKGKTQLYLGPLGGS
jgi:hypothetical protein